MPIFAARFDSRAHVALKKTNTRFNVLNIREAAPEITASGNYALQCQSRRMSARPRSHYFTAITRCRHLVETRCCVALPLSLPYVTALREDHISSDRRVQHH